MTTLFFFILSILIVTGGYEYRSSSLKFELAQVDLFAWAFFLFLSVRRMRFGQWWQPTEEKRIQAVGAWMERHSTRFVLTGISIYIFLQTFVSINRYRSFHANAFDLSYVDQSIFSTFRYGFLHSSLGLGGTYLGEHFSPILALFSPFYFLTDSVYVLFFLQSLLMGFSAWLVFTLARAEGLKNGLSTLIAICFLIYQPLRAANQFDFREDAFFIPVFLGAIWLGKHRRWLGFSFLVVVSWLIKENGPIFSALLSCVFLFREVRKTKRSDWMKALPWLAVMVCSGIVFFLVNTKITPYFAGGASHTKAVHRLGQFGQTPGEILRFVFIHPFEFLWALCRLVFQKQTLLYLAQVLTPFVIFIAAAPGWFMVAAAGLVMNILVNMPTVGFHYECILIPFLFYGLIEALQKRKEFKTNWTRPGALLLVAFLLFFGRSPIYAIRKYWPTSRDLWVERELKKIPRDASVTTQSALLPHLDHRKDAFLFSVGPINTDYAVFDFHPSRDQYGTPNMESQVEKLKTSFVKVLDQEHLVIFKKSR